MKKPGGLGRAGSVGGVVKPFQSLPRSDKSQSPRATATPFVRYPAKTRPRSHCSYSLRMSTLGEIETAIDALPAAEHQELLLFIASRLRGVTGNMPKPRKYTQEQVDAWIAEDNAEMQQLRDSGKL